VGKTRGKLDEAQFFLRELEKKYPECPESNYYLSAFFSSARSITWVMQNEYHDIEGWKAWYDAREPTSDKQLLLAAANRVRTRATKEEPLRTGRQVEIHPARQRGRKKALNRLEEMIASGGEFDIEISPGERLPSAIIHENRVTISARLKVVGLALDEFPNEDALEVCKAYLSLLEELVTECERRFGLGDTGSSEAAHWQGTAPNA
jgi:hypothetical protein